LWGRGLKESSWALGKGYWLGVSEGASPLSKEKSRLKGADEVHTGEQSDSGKSRDKPYRQSIPSDITRGSGRQIVKVRIQKEKRGVLSKKRGFRAYRSWKGKTAL